MVETMPTRAVVRKEKRSYARVRVQLAVSCERAGAPPVAGVARDLGVGGMFIESAEQLPFGTAVEVVIGLPGMKRQTRLPAIVRWSKPDGFGVQFSLLGAQQTSAILMAMK